MKTLFSKVLIVLVILSLLLSSCDDYEELANIGYPTGPWYVANLSDNCKLVFRVTWVWDSGTADVEYAQYQKDDDYVNVKTETTSYVVEYTDTNGKPTIGTYAQISCQGEAYKIRMELEIVGDETIVKSFYDVNNYEMDNTYVVFDFWEKTNQELPNLGVAGKSNGSGETSESKRKLASFEPMGFDTPVDLVIKEELGPESKQELDALENKLYNIWDKRIEVIPVENAVMEKLMSDGLDIGYAFVKVVGENVEIVIDKSQEGKDVYIPVNYWTASQMQYLMKGLTSYSTDFRFAMDYVFHWAEEYNKLNPADKYNLAAAATLARKVFEAAKASGNLYQMGSRVMATAQVMNRSITIIIDESGAMVTTILTDMRKGKINSAFSDSYIASKVSSGWTKITSEDLPQGIKDNWSKSGPSVIRLVMWSLWYQIKTFAKVRYLAFVDAFLTLQKFYMASTTDFIVVFWPSCMTETMCPKTE